MNYSIKNRFHTESESKVNASFALDLCHPTLQSKVAGFSKRSLAEAAASIIAKQASSSKPHDNTRVNLN
jgi:hypothetical protein